VKLDVSGLEYALRTRLEKEADAFVGQLADLDRAQSFRKLWEFAATLPFPVNSGKFRTSATARSSNHGRAASPSRERRCRCPEHFKRARHDPGKLHIHA